MSGDFNPYSQDDDFWKTYMKGRPIIPESFFNLIYDYHTSKGGSFDTVHDAGAGAGVQSVQLSKKFYHVLLSDPSEENLSVASQKLRSDQYSFCLAKLEDVHDIEKTSIDMVHCGTMLHWTDLDKALEAVAHQLKPGGTFAVYFCGVPVMTDPKTDAIWKAIMQQGHADMAMNLPRDSPGWTAMLRGGLMVGSAYDSVPLPEKYFEPGAQRIRLNWPKDWNWYDYMIYEGLRDDFIYSSAIGEHDAVSRQMSPGWELKTDMQGLRDNLASMSLDVTTPGMTKLMQELEKEVGDGMVEGMWPVSLLLATRK